MADDFEFLDYSPEGDAFHAAVEMIHAERRRWREGGVAQEDLVVLFLQGVTKNPDPNFWHELPDGVHVAVAPRERGVRVFQAMRRGRQAVADAAIQMLERSAPAGTLHCVWMLGGRLDLGSVEVEGDGIVFSKAELQRD